MLYVIKKDGTREEFNPQKIVAAVNKSAERILYTFSDEEKDFICRFAQEHADSLGKNEIEIQEMHNIVEGALERVNPAVAKSYRDYRNYKLDFIHMMDDMDIQHDWIQFEITETVATEYNAGLGMVVDGFMAAGVRLCLDDFGSGYANLNTVMRLPFSAIKIDRTLLFDICNDKKRAMFYQSIIETFHRMGYSIVSEGVETEEEMSLLSSWGVDMIQGYYFSRPLPVEELLKLLSM